MGCVGADEHLPASSAKAPEEAFCGVRMKFLCSQGGKILPKPDGQLRYVGGDTRLVSFSKNIGFTDLTSKLEKLFGPNLCLKYQLPNEDLDTLISVTCDDDVENLVEEYDKNEARDGASRLRAFLFPRTGLPIRDVNPCSCQGMDEAKSPREHKGFETISSPRLQVTDCPCPGTATFQMPDYLFGLDSACSVHACGHQHQEGDNQLSPRTFVDDKGSLAKSVRPFSPTAMQVEYSRQQSSKIIDSGGRGPALTTSALGPLVSTHHHHMWDRRKAWDEGSLINQRDEKHHVELNAEAHHHNSQRDAGIGIPMVRVSSKDRIVPNFMEGTTTDTQLMMERQTRPQSMPRADLLPELPEAFSDARQDVPVQGNIRLYKPPESQRVPALNVAPSEMQWGLPQPTLSGFNVVAERSTDSCRNSGDSDEGMHRKLEGHSAADSIAHIHPIVITAEGSHGFKMQEPYRHEEPIVKQQLRHGEFEGSTPLQVQHEHFHNLGKSHFQQVYWQLHDSQEQQQHQTSMLETVRIGHNTHGMQRHGQPLDFHAPSSGMAAHHHHMICTSNNVRTIPRPDTLPNTRLPSPLYRQVASASASRPDPPSPRRGQLPSNSSQFSSRHGVRVLQMHDVGYMPSSKVQQSSGLPGSQVFLDPVEAHNLYDQSGSQSHLAEKGTLASLDAAINQGQYFDKIILANQDGAIGQVHCDDDLPYGCLSNNQEAQVVSPQQYGRLINNQEAQGVLPQ